VSHTYYTAQASQNFTVTLTVIDDLGSTDSYSRTVTSEDWQPVAGFEMVQTPGGVAWGVADITINGAGDDVQTVSFRSVAPTGWTAGVPKAAGTTPANFTTDKNLSYDPEGQDTPNGWGITQYLCNYDGGVPTDGLTTRPAGAGGECATHWVRFQLGATENSRTFNVTFTVVDVQGAQKSLTRKVRLNR